MVREIGSDLRPRASEALERVIALRIHLDDSTADNGPLRVLPGTHRWACLATYKFASWRFT